MRMDSVALCATLGEGWGTRRAIHVLESIASAVASCTPQRYLIALGIPGVGPSAANILLDHFGSVRKVLRASHDDLGRVHGIGHVTAEAITAFWQEEGTEMERVIRECHMDAFSAPVTMSRGAVGVVVVTGTIPGTSRAAVTRLLREHGWHVASAVSASTRYIVTGDAPGRTKVAQAEALGIPVMPWKEFCATYHL